MSPPPPPPAAHQHQKHHHEQTHWMFHWHYICTHNKITLKCNTPSFASSATVLVREQQNLVPQHQRKPETATVVVVEVEITGVRELWRYVAYTILPMKGAGQRHSAFGPGRPPLPSAPPLPIYPMENITGRWALACPLQDLLTQIHTTSQPRRDTTRYSHRWAILASAALLLPPKLCRPPSRGGPRWAPRCTLRCEAFCWACPAWWGTEESGGIGGHGGLPVETEFAPHWPSSWVVAEAEIARVVWSRAGSGTGHRCRSCGWIWHVGWKFNGEKRCDGLRFRKPQKLICTRDIFY
jgi:hypothetical protein